MNLALVLGRVFIPASMRKNQLRKLSACTAEAFRRPPPRMAEGSCAAALRAYALLTRDLAEESFREGEDEHGIRDRLYRNAYQLGCELREWLRPATPEEVRVAMRLIYRVIGIDARFDVDGSVTVRSCYFSGYYPGRTCRLMSALDAGVAAGLSGGGRLSFTQRMTEGHDCCLARLEPGEA